MREELDLWPLLLAYTLVEVGVVAATAAAKQYHSDTESPVSHRIGALNAELLDVKPARGPWESRSGRRPTDSTIQRVDRPDG